MISFYLFIETHAGQKPSQGTLFKASQFLHGKKKKIGFYLHILNMPKTLEELPIRLAHRVKELEELPHNLSHMPSIVKVKNWYAQSFQDLVELPSPTISNTMREKLITKTKSDHLPHSVPNPSLVNMTKPQNVLQASIPIAHR